LLLNISVWSQQTQQATTPTPAPKDPQAVSVVNQALAVAGGTPAIRAIQDYTGSGNITYNSEQDGTGTVMVLGLAGTEFRMDANLPAGARSFAVSGGVISTKDEKGTIWSMMPKNPVSSSDVYPFQTPLFPSSIAFPTRQLTAVVNNPIYSLSYKGIAQADGHSAYDIETQRVLSGVAERTRDIFIDSTSFQVVKVSETLPKGVPHSIHYSDFRPVGGILMPYTISEEVAGQQIWTIQLNQINFNTGLQVASFTIQ
jgi:hypothetical protein